MKWLAVAFFLTAPFWETKAPADWTEEELQSLLTDSPWAQMSNAPGDGPAVQVYLATAGPMEQAEQERERRFRRKRPNEQTDETTLEYREWLQENRANSIVVAIAVPKFDTDTQRMEEECLMRVGRKKFKMTGHFPPTAHDPFLRIAFPREVKASDKNLTFDLYLPGAPIPYRSVEFKVRDMVVGGKLEI